MREAAQTHYLSGARFFEAGQYDAALVEFEAAFRLSGEADFLHNISWTHEKAGRIKDAIEYAVRYQAAVPTGEDQERARRRWLNPTLHELAIKLDRFTLIRHAGLGPWRAILDPHEAQIDLVRS